MIPKGWLPDLDSLRCAALLAESRNFRRASERAGLSPAAFSERIKRLERDLAVDLFHRSTRHVDLTERGAELLPDILALVHAASDLRERASRESGPRPFELRIGTRFELGLSWLVPSLSPLTAAQPHRRIHLTFGDGPDLLRAVEAGTLDALVASVRLSRSDLDYALLHEEAYVLAASPTALERRPLRTPEDASAHTLLDLHDALPLFRYFLDAAPADQTWRFGERETLGTIAAVRLRALEGAGVAVLPAYFIAADLDAGDLVPLAPDVAMRTDWFRLVWRDGHPRSRALRELAAELRARPLR